MKNMKIIIPLVTLWLLTASAFAQKIVITGKVTSDIGGTPMAGVSVFADKTKQGIASKDDGTYSISVDPGTTVLLFSFVGYKEQAVTIAGRKVIDVVMQVSSATTDDVVVVGYGTQKRATVTGSVSKYQNDRLDEVPQSRLDQALQGKIAGVQIQNVSPEAGAEPKVRIRGISSINAGASPLVVVDGHPVPDGLAFVNMADVQSVDVLKDAASAAIYGSRGASGVILITTKSGKANKPKFGIKMSTGTKQAYERYDMMTTSEYTQMLFDEAALKLQDPSIPPPTTAQIASTPERGAYIIENDLRGGEATDWQSEALRTASTKNIQMNVSGGNSGLKYYVSGGYQDDPGMMYHSEYERFTIKTKVDANLSKRVKLSINLNPSFIKRERPSVNYIDFVRFQSYLPVYLDEKLAAFVRENPAYADVKAGDYAQARYFNGRVYNGTMPDGSIWANTTAVTPFNTANNSPKSVMETRTISQNDYRVLTSGDLTVNILPGFDFKTLASAYVNYTQGLDFAKRNSNRAGDVNRGIYNKRLFVDLLSENTFTYSNRFGNHSVSALAGFTAQKTTIDDEQITAYDYPSDNITTLNTALTVDQDRNNTFNTKNQIGLLSYLGRITYSYKEKYLFNATIRADGSSYFGPGNKWGYFPSVSAGWIVSNEGFMENVSWLNNLKLRGSYGVTGNNRIIDFAFVDLLYAANYPFGSTSNGTVSTGQLPSRSILSNPDITWERTFQYNAGIDISVLKNTINLSVDVYKSETDQLLLQQAALGFTGAPLAWNNIGRLRNNGVELELTTFNVRKKNFTWSTAANFARTRNKIMSLSDEAFLLNQGERTELYLNRVGEPLIQFFGYKTDGVWLSQAEIDAAKAKGLNSNLSNVFVAGGLKLVDLDGNNVIDANDRTVIGNPYPDFTWGITNNFKIFDFDLMFLVQGVQGGTLINGDPNYNETKRYNRNYNSNRWISPMFPGDGKTPYSTFGFNWMLTDYVVEDASYAALRELLVGYTLPSKVTQWMRLSSLRVYFSAQNLFFITGSNYRGINPEARFSSGPYQTPLVDGYQRGSFPIPKTMLFGIDINF